MNGVHLNANAATLSAVGCRPPWLTVLAALGLMAIQSPDASAQTPTPAFTGTWANSNDPQETKQRHQAIDAATQDMSRFMRGRARSRLKERMVPPPKVTIKVRGDQLALSMGERPMNLRLGAEPIQVERDGKKAALSARLDGGRLVVTSKGESGQRVTTYAVSADGRRLTQSVVMTAKRLGRPLRYRSTYRRQ